MIIQFYFLILYLILLKLLQYYHIKMFIFYREGDTGEKDEEAGERIAAKYPNKVRAIFLHTVYKSDKSSPKTATATAAATASSRFVDRKVAGVPIFYFRTYIGAAGKAYRSNIISREALKRVAERAVEELKAQQTQQQSITAIKDSKVNYLLKNK